MKNVKTKQCIKCKEQIDIKAKKCPHCGAKQISPIWTIGLIALIVFVVIVGAGGDSEDSSYTGSGSNSSQTQENIEYIKITKDDLDAALENNAAAAKEAYNKKYVEISGKLGTIDSDLKYISLDSSTKNWDLRGIHCYIKNDQQKAIVMSLTKDQEITIRGKITNVGEVVGYYLDITEIIAN